MLVFWDCDGLRSVYALLATAEESLHRYIWILAECFKMKSGAICGGVVFLLHADE